MSIVSSTSGLAISAETTSDGVGSVVVSSVTFSVLEILLVLAERLDENLVCTAATPNLWENRGFPRCGSGLADAGFFPWKFYHVFLAKAP